MLYSDLYSSSCLTLTTTATLIIIHWTLLLWTFSLAFLATQYTFSLRPTRHEGVHSVLLQLRCGDTRVGSRWVVAPAPPAAAASLLFLGSPTASKNEYILVNRTIDS